MNEILIWIEPSDAKFNQPIRQLFELIIADTSEQASVILAGLPKEIFFTICASSRSTGQTGLGGYSVEPFWVDLSIDPEKEDDWEDIIHTHLKSTVLHELNHCARATQFGMHSRFRDSIIAEGLASVFERELGESPFPYADYDISTIDDWVAEILPLDEDLANFQHWFFEHPDGRKWIGYKTGARIVDLAQFRTGVRIQEMTTWSTKKILDAAGL